MPEHAALITVMLLDRPTCLPCIATKTGMSIPKVTAYLEQIAKSVMVHQAPRETCRVCGTIGPTVSIGRVL